MNIPQILKRAEKVVTDNSPLILTVVGVAGTVGTAVLAAKASFKAAEIIRIENEKNDVHDLYMPVKDAVKLTWPLYIPTAVSACGTVAAIVTLNHVGTRRAAALAAAYTISDKAFTEYKEKVKEIVGENKEQKVRDAVAEDQLKRNPVSNTQVIVTGGDVLCHEPFTGRYWMCDAETLKKAENEINYQIINDSYASLGDFYSLVGLPQTDNSQDIGWNLDKLMDLQITGGLAEDGRPCLVVSYTVAPIKAYHKFH